MSPRIFINPIGLNRRGKRAVKAFKAWVAHFLPSVKAVQLRRIGYTNYLEPRWTFYYHVYWQDSSMFDDREHIVGMTTDELTLYRSYYKEC